MISRDKLASYLHEFLDCASFKDYAPNGLQVEGRAEIKRICTAVTASLEAIEHAISLKADALLVHHGYFWKAEELALSGVKRKRIATLLAHDISLFAYHLPLDCHPQLGNNACLAKLFDLNAIEQHTALTIPKLLWSGTLSQSKTIATFRKEVEQLFKRPAFHIEGKSREIKRIAWCTGAAENLIEQAHQLGVDAYLSGEIALQTFYLAKELGIHYFSCGHHATERYGISALGEHLESQFKLEHYFFDSANPI